MERDWIWLVILTLAFICITAVHGNGVVTLTQANFEKEVGRDRYALVEFFTPWCGRCKKLASEYEKLGSAFKRTKSVLISKVDCEDQKTLCKKYGIQGYPTILWFPKGSLESKEYKGPWDVDDLVEFIKEEGDSDINLATNPSFVVPLTPENFDQIVFDKMKDVLLVFYAPWCGYSKMLIPTYEKLAAAYKLEEDIIFANIDSDNYRDLAEKHGVSGYPTMKFFPKSNKIGEHYVGGHDLSSLVTFINERCSKNRDTDGQLTSQAGVIASLDMLVKEFLSAASDEQKTMLSRMDEQVKNLEGSMARFGNIYLKIAKSFMEKGPNYPKKEIKRLQRILEQSINAVKADELVIKKNILSTFAA
ncbi:hypothetical protein HPP92_015391 [Vanilla planifolia]|uniref:protein disulfide-isomerase n=1 Tax=Vanilla planifolia TaxID=51239 RepID=A0A835UX60_VANPL|nr:hypothetical protein HPP92_015391 [Vanilla planifolia]